MCAFMQTSANPKGLESFITKLSYIYQIEVSNFFKQSENIFIHMSLVHLDNTLKLFQILPFPISNSLRPNSSMISTLDKDFIVIGKTHHFMLKSLTEIHSWETYGTLHLCQGNQTVRNNLEDTCLWAYYLEKFSVILNYVNSNLFQFRNMFSW